MLRQIQQPAYCTDLSQGGPFIWTHPVGHLQTPGVHEKRQVKKVLAKLCTLQYQGGKFELHTSKVHFRFTNSLLLVPSRCVRQHTIECTRERVICTMELISVENFSDFKFSGMNLGIILIRSSKEQDIYPFF